GGLAVVHADAADQIGMRGPGDREGEHRISRPADHPAVPIDPVLEPKAIVEPVELQADRARNRLHPSHDLAAPAGLRAIGHATGRDGGAATEAKAHAGLRACALCAHENGNTHRDNPNDVFHGAPQEIGASKTVTGTTLEVRQPGSRAMPLPPAVSKGNVRRYGTPGLWISAVVRASKPTLGRAS